MKVICVIPARFGSTRLRGKPLIPICGKAMIHHVYDKAKKVEWFNETIVATDSELIADYCKQNNIPFIMTSEDCPNHIHRVYEVSTMLQADYYVSVNGDEPLIDVEAINAVKPQKVNNEQPYFGSVYRELTDPAEVLDWSNVKIVLDANNYCMYQSRTPIPTPKGTVCFKYKKAIGIECFNALALSRFATTPMSELEKIEDIDHLRFLQNGIPIYYTQVFSEAISVDTKSDLEKVEKILKNKAAE